MFLTFSQKLLAETELTWKVVELEVMATVAESSVLYPYLPPSNNSLQI